MYIIKYVYMTYRYYCSVWVAFPTKDEKRAVKRCKLADGMKIRYGPVLQIQNNENAPRVRTSTCMECAKTVF